MIHLHPRQMNHQLVWNQALIHLQVITNHSNVRNINENIDIIDLHPVNHQRNVANRGDIKRTKVIKKTNDTKKNNVKSF